MMNCQKAYETIVLRDKIVCREIGGEDWVARLCFEYLKTPCNAASGSLKQMIIWKNPPRIREADRRVPTTRKRAIL